MGPVNNPTTHSGERFRAWYARYSRRVSIVMAKLILAPVVHRMPHLFHADERDK